MDWLGISFFALLIGAGVSMLILALYAFRRREMDGAMAYAGFCVCAAFYAIFYALEVTSPNLETALFWSKIEYFGIAFMPACGLIFILQFTGHDALLQKGRIALPWIIPTIIFLLRLTNEHHRLIYREVSVIRQGSLLVLDITGGAWYWVYVIYINHVLIVSCILLFLMLFRSSSTYRLQGAVVLLGILAPWAGHLFYQAAGGLWGLDTSPVAFAISGILWAVALFKLGVFDLAPIAKEFIFASIRDAVVVLDQRDRVVDYNTAAGDLFVPAMQHAFGKTKQEFFRDTPQVLSLIDQDVERKELIIDFGGGPRNWDVKKSAVFDRHDKLRGRVLTFGDMTERRQLEQMRNELIYMMVHDLRNPLSSILASLQIVQAIESGALSGQTAEPLKIAWRSCEQMVGLINAILDINRLESGQMPLKHELVSLPNVVNEILLLSSSLITEKKLHVENRLSPLLPPLWVDRHLIMRVMQNLLDNAVKFTPARGLIRIDCRSVDANWAEISVGNTGPGIDSQIKERLFGKFVSGMQPERGSGLGLAFCRLAVEAHGGRIQVESLPDQETVFRFTVPAAPSAGDEPQS